MCFRPRQQLQCRLNGKKLVLLIFIGRPSVYFIVKILAATDRLELLFRHSNIRFLGMTQCMKEKGHFLSGTCCPACGVSSNNGYEAEGKAF